MSGFYPQRVPPPAPVKNDGKAIASLVFGLLSLTCAGLFTGIPAMLLGSLAHKDIRESRGRTIGSGMATAGSVLGAFGTFFNVLFFLGAAYLVITTPRGPGERTDVSLASQPAQQGGPSQSGQTNQPARGLTTGKDDFGVIDVVHAGQGDQRPLRLQLFDAQKRAETQKKTLVVVSRATWAASSRKFEASLADPRMQVAFANTVLVMVDLDEYGSELSAFGCTMDSVPFFFKLDSRQHAVDAIGTAEWDEETPGDMAPVLTQFVQGTYAKRREPPAVGTLL
jgi:hypothetical protein